MNYLTNAMSLNMFTIDQLVLIRAKKVEAKDVPTDVISAIGHADTAKVVSNILGFEVPCNRMNVSLNEDDILYVAQYRGPRLEEGATQLPEGATIEFIEVTVLPNGCSGCPSSECNYCNMMSWMRGK